MKSAAAVLVSALLATGAHAEQLVSTRRGVVVASPVRVALLNDGRAVWTEEGVQTPGFVAADDESVVVLDPIRNEAAVFDLASGARRTWRTAETPVAALFHDGALFVLSRDARLVERIDRSGTRRTLATGPDPAFLRAAGNVLVAYSRGDGKLQVIEPSSLRVVREGNTKPFASDLEIDAKTLYLTYPREATVRQVDLATLAPAGELRIGAVPVDLAIERSGNALSAGRLSIADPAARRVWTIEGRQSIAQAFARGFVRGLIGLGLFRHGAAEFPTGVDRIAARNGRLIAYDSSSGTIYLSRGKAKPRPIASGVEAGAFAVTADGVAWLQDGTLRVAH